MGVVCGLHCTDKKSVLWLENTVKGDSLEDQSKVVTILKWIQRIMTLACGLDFSILVLGPAAGCCEHGSKPWVPQNPRNHTFFSRNCFLISVLSTELPLDYTANTCLYKNQTARIAISNVSILPRTVQVHPFPQNFYCYSQTAAVVF